MFCFGVATRTGAVRSAVLPESTGAAGAGRLVAIARSVSESFAAHASPEPSDTSAEEPNRDDRHLALGRKRAPLRSWSPGRQVSRKTRAARPHAGT